MSLGYRGNGAAVIKYGECGVMRRGIAIRNVAAKCGLDVVLQLTMALDLLVITRKGFETRLKIFFGLVW